MSNHSPDRFSRDSVALTCRREVRQAEEFKWCVTARQEENLIKEILDPGRIVVRRNGKILKREEYKR